MATPWVLVELLQRCKDYANLEGTQKHASIALALNDQIATNQLLEGDVPIVQDRFAQIVHRLEAQFLLVEHDPTLPTVIGTGSDAVSY